MKPLAIENIFHLLFMIYLTNNSYSNIRLLVARFWWNCGGWLTGHCWRAYRPLSKLTTRMSFGTPSNDGQGLSRLFHGKSVTLVCLDLIHVLQTSDPFFIFKLAYTDKQGILIKLSTIDIYIQYILIV